MPDFLIGLLAGLTPASAVCLAVALFSSSLVPFFLLLDADFTASSDRLRAAGAAVARPACEAARDVAALLILLCTTPNGATS